MNPTHPDRPDRSSPSTLSDGRKRAVLLTVLLSTLTFPLTITGASLALPDIQADLGAGLSAAQWAVNGYNACFAGFLAVAGSLADVLGRRRVFAGGVTLFFVAGALCGPVGDVLLLNLLRALAGAGAAAAVAGGTSILSETFTGAARARAFGLLGTVLGAGTAFGPTAAGVLVDLLGWRAVFAAPALVAGAVLALCPLLPRLPGAPGRRVDAAGAVSFSAALLLVITVFVEGPERGSATRSLSAARPARWCWAASSPSWSGAPPTPCWTWRCWPTGGSWPTPPRRARSWRCSSRSWSTCRPT
ncbi:MFS transporter [Nocardiopsis composta]